MPLITLLVLFAFTMGCGPAASDADSGPGPRDAGSTADGGSTDGATADAAMTDAALTDGGEPGPATWSHEDVDRGIFPSIAVSADGVVHISHTLVFTNGTGELRHSVAAGARRWETTVVEAGERVGWNAAIALRDGRPIVVRTDPFNIVGATGDVVVHRLDDAGRWTSAMLGTTDAGLSLAVAASPSGLTLAYEARGGVSLARDDTGSWVLGPIESGAMGARGGPALALDAAGAAHVAYADGGGIGYGMEDGAGWSLETIEATSDASPFLSLDLGPDGRAWVAYDVDGDVRVAVHEDTGWVTAEALTGYDPYAVALVVDAAGVAHVVFNDRTTSTVVHARSDEGWTPETIADSGSSAGAVDIATGSGGALHVAYSRFEGSGATLRLATLR